MADGTFRATEVPEDILLAIEIVTGIFDAALTSGAHEPGDWRRLSLADNFEHLATHARKLFVDVRANRETLGSTDDSEDHLANLCCRALMLLQLREETRHANSKHE